MKELRFYGSSDDLFEIEGSASGEPDEIGCYDRIVGVKVANDHEGMYVVAEYAPDRLDNGVACWIIGVQNLDEDIPIPTWAMRFETASRAYSPMLIVEAPDDVRVSEIPTK